MGRHIRRPRSDLDLICPSFMTANVPWEIDYSPLFTHLTVKNLDRTYNPYRFLNTSLCRIGLLGVCIQALYTDFSASRQRRLLVFRRSGHSTTCRCPNSDSAEAFHNRFYCSPDSHTTFTCDSKGATP